MKTQKKKSTLPRRLPRSFDLYARFTPEGRDAADRLAFFEFFLAAIERAGELQSNELAKQKAKFAKLQAARGKADPVLIKALRNKIPMQLAAEKIKRLVPDKQMLHELFEVWDKAVRATPEQAAQQTEELEQRKRKLEHSERLHKARSAIINGLSALAEAAEAGDAKAATDLAESAIEATALLHIIERKHPAFLGPVARGKMQWPVLANDEAGWEQEAVRCVARLELGADLRRFKISFRKARGTDANLPARRWAKAAVRVIEETRFRILSFGKVLQEFGSHKALAEFCMETGWRIGDEPDWVSEVPKLGKFSTDSLPKWKRVIREMIRTQMSDFHSKPEWITQRNSAVARGRGTAGEIQNAILDDISSALERIAPAPEVPKPGC